MLPGLTFRRWLRYLRAARLSLPNRWMGMRTIVRPGFRPRLLELEERLAPAAYALSTANVVEPGPGGTALMDFTVTRNVDISSQVSVSYTTTAGTATPNVDFTPQSGTATFAPGSTTALIKIPVFGTNAYNNLYLSFAVQLTGEAVYGTTFSSKTDIAVGSPPVAIGQGDINRDGRPDLIIVSSSTNSVAVLLNTTGLGSTTPTFAAPQSFSTGNNPVAVVVGDINLDGSPDLVVANDTTPGSVSVLLNLTPPGSTTLSLAPHFDLATGASPVALAVGDLNNDGKLDLAVANSGSNTVSVLLNNTSPGAVFPTFAGQMGFMVGTVPSAVAIGDFNGDGWADLAVANSGSNTVSVLANTMSAGATTPSFAANRDFATGATPDAVAIGDLNGDGLLDLAVANFADNTVSVLLNTTTPGVSILAFRARQDFSAGQGPTAIVMRDVNGDGQPDLTVVDNTANTVSVLLNSTVLGTATALFTPPQTFATGNTPAGVTLADINGDGEPDLLVADSGTGTNAVSVLVNTTPLPDAAVTTAFPATQLNMNGATQNVIVGDINGDGKPDLLVSPNFGSYAVSVFMNSTAPGAAAPSFASPATFNAPLGPKFLVLADINRDGKPDLVVVNYKDNSNNSVGIFLNTTPTGSMTTKFGPVTTFVAGTNEQTLAVADFNGDGLPDIAVGNYNGSAGVLTNTTPAGASTPSFTTSFFPTGGGSTDVTSGDINGDGKPDLITANRTAGNVSVLLNLTTPGAATPIFSAATNFVAGNVPQTVAVGDLNGDGRLDLEVSNENSNAVILMNATPPGAGTPSFGAASKFTPNSGYNGGVVQDINGDGKPDVLLNNYFSGGQYAMVSTTAPGSTTPTFTTKKIAVLNRGTNYVGTGYFNGNGRPDPIVTTQGSSYLTIYMNTPSSVPTGIAFGAINDYIQFAAPTEAILDNSGTFTITATLAFPSPNQVTVPFSVGGTAAAGTNYSGLTGPFVFLPGQTSATITGQAVSVGHFDVSKTLTFTLGTPTNAVLGSVTVNTLTIQTSSPAPVATFALANQTTVEKSRDHRGFCRQFDAILRGQHDNPICAGRYSGQWCQLQ